MKKQQLKTQREVKQRTLQQLTGDQLVSVTGGNDFPSGNPPSNPCGGSRPHSSSSS